MIKALLKNNRCRWICMNMTESYNCNQNFIWHLRYCKCVCDLLYMYKQTLDEENCACKYKKKFLKRCSRKKQIINSETYLCENRMENLIGGSAYDNRTGNDNIYYILDITTFLMAIIIFLLFIYFKQKRQRSIVQYV